MSANAAMDNEKPSCKQRKQLENERLRTYITQRIINLNKSWEKEIFTRRQMNEIVGKDTIDMFKEEFGELYLER